MRSRHLRGCMLVLVAFGAGSASGTAVPAGGLQVISRPSGTGSIPHANIHEQYSTRQGISDDGRYIAFASPDDSLSTADDNRNTNVFRLDRSNGSVELVSRADGTNGAPANAGCFQPVISSDGRMVAFYSKASNLDPAAPGGTYQVFVRDTSSDTTELVSRGGASNLVADSDSTSPSINANGTRVAFASVATNFVDLGAAPRNQVYVRDLALGTTELVSRADTSIGAIASQGAFRPSISGDGSAVAFYSSSTNLVTGLTDTNNSYDVFIRRLSSETNELVSKSGTGTIGNSSSYDPSVNYDGTRIAFNSSATNLDPDDTDSSTDVYVRDTAAGTTVIVSRADGVAGPVDDAGSNQASISGDGKVIAFVSQAGNLVPGAGKTDYGGRVYVRDLTPATPTTSLVDRATGASGAISDLGAYYGGVSRDGTKVLFDTSSTNLTTPPGDADGEIVLVRDLTAKTTTPIRPVVSNATYYNWSAARAVSRDGRYVAFMSDSDGLSTENDDRWWGIYRRDTLTNTTVLVSRASGVAGAGANRWSNTASISSDGSRIAFESTATSLVPGDTNGTTQDCFVRDLATNTTILASRTEAGGPLTRPSYRCVLTGNGNRVAFLTDQSLDPADADTSSDVYVRDIATNQTLFASRQNGPSGPGATGTVGDPALNANGTKVAFYSGSALTSEPITGQQVYLRDLPAGTTTLISRATGAAGAIGDGWASQPVLNASGSRVVFASYATNLVPVAVPPFTAQLYARDLSSATTTLVSRAMGAGGAIAANGAYTPAMSDDGTRVVFYSDSGNLVSGDTNGQFDVFVRDLAASTTTAVNPLAATDAAFVGAISGNGHCVSFFTAADNVDPSVGATDVAFVYLKTLTGECPNEPPDTSITGSPPAKTRSRSATITLSSNDPTATFQCALDGAAFAACGASYALNGLAEGSHTIQVRAVDPAGNVDATPASATWAIDATAPVLRIAIIKQRLKRVLARGLRLRVRSSEAATLNARVTRKGRTLGRARKSIGTAPKTLTIRLHLSKKARRALAKAKSVRLLLVVVGKDSLGNTRTLRRTVKIRR